MKDKKEHIEVEANSRHDLNTSVMDMFKMGWRLDGYAFIRGLKFVQKMVRDKP